MTRLFKWLTFIIVLFTTIVIPAIFLETPFSRYGETALAWAGENTIYTSIVSSGSSTLAFFGAALLPALLYFLYRKLSN